jgi:hypothetical protein
MKNGLTTSDILDGNGIGTSEAIMYVRKDNSMNEIMKQVIDLIKNWRVRASCKLLIYLTF